MFIYNLYVDVFILIYLYICIDACISYICVCVCVYNGSYMLNATHYTCYIKLVIFGYFFCYILTQDENFSEDLTFLSCCSDRIRCLSCRVFIVCIINILSMLINILRFEVHFEYAEPRTSKLVTESQRTLSG